MKYTNLLLELKNKLREHHLEESIANVIFDDLLGSQYYVCLNEEVKKEHLVRVYKILDRLYKKEPIQYILGYTYFYGLKINVNQDVLIPRNETEELVDWVLKSEFRENLTIVDVGCGSGCIALAIKKNRPTWKVIGVDISKDALKVAKENAKYLNLDVTFIESDLLKNINEHIDIVVSNPPYIAENDIHVDESTYMYEPHLALYAEDEGLEIYKRLKEELINKNIPTLFIEYGYDQKQKIIDIYKKYHIELKKDINKNDRMARIKF